MSWLWSVIKDVLHCVLPLENALRLTWDARKYKGRDARGGDNVGRNADEGVTESGSNKV